MQFWEGGGINIEASWIQVTSRLPLSRCLCVIQGAEKMMAAGRLPLGPPWQWLRVSSAASAAFTARPGLVKTPQFLCSVRQANVALTVQTPRHVKSLNLISLVWSQCSGKSLPLELPVSTPLRVHLAPGCSDLYAATWAAVRQGPKSQGMGKHGKLSCRAKFCCRKPGWHLCVQQGTAATGAERNPTPEWKQRDLGEAPALGVRGQQGRAFGGHVELGATSSCQGPTAPALQHLPHGDKRNQTAFCNFERNSSKYWEKITPPVI